MSYFALGNLDTVEGVIAINLTVVEHMLEVIGPLYLPDYQVTVTADNIAEVARSERDTFFPGSQQKAAFLRALTVQFKLAVQNLRWDQWLILWQRLLSDSQRKDIQVFSHNSAVQALAEHMNLDGQVWLEADHDGIMQIEANVGINKVNKWVSRKSQLDVDDYIARVETVWSNAAAPPGGAAAQSPQITQLSPPAKNGYVNYHRIWVPPTWTPQQATLFTGSEPPTILTPDQLTSSIITVTNQNQEQSWREVGLLVRVPQGQTTTLTMSFGKPSFADSPKHITMFHQSGIPPMPFTFTTPNGSSSWVQDSDVSITLLQ
jgi:hypothetical protein